jgi:hypothetical protein
MRCGLAASAAGLCVWGGGCSQAKVAGDAGAQDAPGRIPALVRQADGQHDPGNKGLGELVRALDDEDPAVRLFAAQALRERSGESFGYRYYDSRAARRPAVRAWRAWADAQDDGGGTAPPTNTAAAPTDDTP